MGKNVNVQKGKKGFQKTQPKPVSPSSGGFVQGSASGKKSFKEKLLGRSNRSITSTPTWPHYPKEPQPDYSKMGEVVKGLKKEDSSPNTSSKKPNVGLNANAKNEKHS